MKKSILSHSKAVLFNDFKENLTEIENKFDFVHYSNKDLLFNLGNTKTPIEEIIEENTINTSETTEKLNYHFPEVLKMGELLNLRTSPSNRILSDEGYLTRVPFLLPIRDFGLGFFSNIKYKNQINATIEQSVLKLISSLPNGLVKLSLMDKNGSGIESFSRLTTLHSKFFDGKVLSEDSEIELELEKIKNSMTIITQSIAANGFKSIEEYNVKTDEAPQQYRIIAISNFPAGFNKKASENLLSLLEAGPRAGIYVFLTFSLNPEQGFNQTINGISLSDFIKHISVFSFSDRPNEYTQRKHINYAVDLMKIPLLNEKEFKQLTNNVFSIKFEEPDEEEIKKTIAYLNERIEKVSLKPIIDLNKAYPNELWTKQGGKGICVPFGKRGIENVYFSLGVNQYGEDEDTHHGMIGGSTGSGKTVFIHTLILSIAMNYSPKEVQFYLLDYKEGTEFAIYKDFPYVNILSMESEIEFGQEVLKKASSLISERGDLFKEKKAANLAYYNSIVSEEEKLPRIILIIDEFQVLFPNNQKVSMITNEYINDIVRRGRSFGVNLILSTQTIQGIDLEQSILSNMPLRIALKMNEKDSVKFLGEGNKAPIFMTSPGEGIYNKSFGQSQQNVNFQAFRAINEMVPNTINMIKKHIENTMSINEQEDLYEKRFVYSGEQIPLLENNVFINKAIKEGIENKSLYIGEPAGLSKEDLKIEFKKEFGDNLMIVGSSQEKAASLFYSLIFQIEKLRKKEDVKTYLGIYSGDFNKFKEFKELNLFGNQNSEKILEEIYQSLLERKKNEDTIYPDIFFFNFFLENGKIFIPEGFSSKNLEKIKAILKDGPEVGIYSILYAGSFETLTAIELSRELSKFKKKIAIQGGNSIKLFGSDTTATFANAKELIAIVQLDNNSSIKKFKPYVVFEVKKEIGDK